VSGTALTAVFAYCPDDFSAAAAEPEAQPYHSVLFLAIAWTKIEIKIGTKTGL
jgi:hypothetical protein